MTGEIEGGVGPPCLEREEVDHEKRAEVWKKAEWQSLGWSEGCGKIKHGCWVAAGTLSCPKQQLIFGLAKRRIWG